MLTKVQVRNTNTTTNLNNVTATVVPVTGTTDYVDPDFSVQVPPIGNGIICNFTGDVRVTFNLYATGADPRSSLDVLVTVNRVSQGAVFNQMYIRANGGHNFGGVSGSVWVSVNAGDVVRIETLRSSSSVGAVTMPSGGSLLLLERWN